jgi:hypothetical protein
MEGDANPISRRRMVDLWQGHAGTIIGARVTPRTAPWQLAGGLLASAFKSAVRVNKQMRCFDRFFRAGA